MEDMEFDTPGILRDILDRMERDFGLNRLSLPSNILEPLHQFSRGFNHDEDSYTSLPTFSVSAKAELLNDADDWWRLPLQRRRKFRSKLFPKHYLKSTRRLDASPDRYSDLDLKDEDSSFDDHTLGKLRGFSDNRRIYTSPKFSDGQYFDGSKRIGESTSIPITISSSLHKDTERGVPVGRSRSVPLQDLQYWSPPRPQSVPSDSSRNLPFTSILDIDRLQKTPEVSQKFDELCSSKNEELKRPTVPDSVLQVGPEIKICNPTANKNRPDIAMTGQTVKNTSIMLESDINRSSNMHCENDGNQSSHDVNGHLRKLLSDFCSDAQRNSLPPVICHKEDLLDKMQKEFRSESLPDIVKCDTRTLNGKVPRFCFRSGENLPWTERQNRIEAALSWLRSELELLRAQDRTLLSQLQRCQETIDVIKKQKSVAAYESDDEEGHWEDWELAEYEKICESDPSSIDKECDSSMDTVISVYELRPVGLPVTDIECSV
ncbi:hypothetical protein ScPMuIL_008348 [Solemya velum]